MQISQALSVRAVNRKKRELLGRAIPGGMGPSAFELLEQRQLLSGSPTVTIAGAPTTNEGADYTLSLSSQNLGSNSIDHWTINWGDGQSTAAGTAASADHYYTDGPHNYTISAFATLNDNSVVQANLGQTSVTQNGALDSSFGAGGKVFSSIQGQGRSAVELNNGQIVEAGLSGTTLELARFDADGSLDTSFGNNGVVSVSGCGFIAKLIVQNIPDPLGTGTVQRLLVVGNNTSSRSTIWRFNLDDSANGLADGSLDSTFGDQGVKTLPQFLSNLSSGDAPADVTLDSQGRIVITATAYLNHFDNFDNQSLAVARLNADGTMDTSFNGTGEAVYQLSGYGGGSTAIGVVTESDDSLLVLAYGTTGGSYQNYFVKFTSSGQLDSSYGAAGVQSLNQPTKGFNAMALDGNQVILAGQANGSSSSYAVARVNLDGSFDNSFGTGGISSVFVDYQGGGFDSVAVEGNGKIVAVGESYAYFYGPAQGTNNTAVAQFNADGTLDTSFGDPQNGNPSVQSGVTKIDFADGNDNPQQVIVQSDGKIVVAGLSDSGSGTAAVWTLARLGSSTTSSQPVTVSVANVAPTAALSAAPDADPEGTAINLVASATDPGTTDQAAGFIYAWTITETHGSTVTSLGNAADSAATQTQAINFTPTDDGTYVVTVTATDKDGAVSAVVSETINVSNVAPTASIDSAPTSGMEGSAITLSGSATDPSSADTAAGIGLGWSVTKNGSAYSTGSGATFTFKPDDNGTYVVTLTGTDKDGGVGSTSDTIGVTNVAPTATITSAPASSAEGTAITVSGSAADVSSADTAAGIGLGWSVTKNGSAYATGAGANYTFTPDDNGTYVITLTATDKDGGATSTGATVNVTNVAPTAVLNSAPSSGNEGTTISISGSASDPSAVDTAAGLSLGWAVAKNGTAFASGSGANFSFTPDDNGTYVVTFTAADKDGGTNSVADTILVANVAPSASILSAPTGGVEGTAIALSGSASDPSAVDTAAGLGLGWSVTKNGAAYASGSGANFSFTPNDNGAYVVTFSATDKDGGVGSTSDTINVINVAPTATITSAPTSGSEGSAISVSGSASDPSSADTAAGLGLGWSVTKNGSAYASGAGANYTFTPNDNGTYVVTLTASDKDGGTSSASKTISVANVAPTAGAISAPAKDVRYETANFSSNFSDPGVLDTHTITWDFGDGSGAVTSTAAAGVTGAISASHVYTTAGTFAVKLTITDKDGGSAVVTKSFLVDIADLQTDPSNASKTALFVGGTPGFDTITVTSGSGSNLNVLIDGQSLNGFAPTGRIIVYGGAGDDIIQIASNISATTELYGGDGNDLIKAGSGPSIEVGGSGSDLLVGGTGRNILIGGGDGDVLVAGSGDDLLVAMSTIYDNNPIALESIQNEWDRTDFSFTQRVNDILHGGGLNGSNLISAATTSNDSTPDFVSGGSGSDLFIVSSNDYVLDATSADKVVDLSWITV